jgi:RNA polymerase sigma-70 factor (ECF subfamily)
VTLDVVVQQSDEDGGPDELAAIRQELDSVAHALRRLTPEQREAIQLRFFAGLSARESAVAMGRQEGTVRGLQFRAIAALRRELGVAPDLDELGRVSGTTR